MKLLKYLPILLILILLITPVSAYLVGREWNQSNASPGLSTCIDTSRNAIACPDWNATLPWSGMGRINTIDTQNQTMVTVPVFYYKSANFTENTFHYMDFWISDTPATGFTRHPAFVSDGRNLQYFLIGAFEGAATNITPGFNTSGYNSGDYGGVAFTATTGDKLSSVPGVKPMSGLNNTGATLPAFRTIAKNRGAGWGLQTLQQVSALELLYAIEYANWDSQSVLSVGVTDITDNATKNMAVNTGFTAGVGTGARDLGNASGQVSISHYQTAQTTTPMSYRGVENLYGNIWKWVDGLNIKANNNPWIADHDFASDVFTHPYIDTALTLPAANGYASNLAYGAGLDYGFLPSAAAGSSSTYLADYYYQATGNRSALLGGSWYHAAVAGAFCWDQASAASLVIRTVGARLAYIPQTPIPTATFTLDRSLVLIPQPVSVNSTSTGSPTLLNVSWGDGQWTNGTGDNPAASHAYSAVGTYGIFLIASNGAGSNQSASQSIRVTDYPTSITNLTNTTPCASEITWTWDNPTIADNPVNADFDITMIYRNNTFWTNNSNLTSSRNWNELLLGTDITFSSRTCNLFGDCNSTWVNKTIVLDGPGPTPTPTPTVTPTGTPATPMSQLCSNSNLGSGISTALLMIALALMVLGAFIIVMAIRGTLNQDIGTFNSIMVGVIVIFAGFILLALSLAIIGPLMSIVGC